MSAGRGKLETFSFRDVTYFIGKRDTSATTPPSLYRAVGSTAREMVEGVENMQILYGVDTTHLAEKQRTAGKYVTADQVGAGGWNDVVSVKISVLMRSFEKNTSGTQTINFNNVALSYNDGYLRQAYSTTITLRNRTVGQQ
jgi:type IV pilus assembly protein PilW